MPDYQIANIWPFIINLPLWISQVYMVVYGTHISIYTRLMPSFAILAASMVIIPLVANIGGATGFYICDVLLLFFGLASGVAQGTTFMAAAAFPFEYMAIVMLGNGISGFGTNLLRGLTLVIWPSSKDDKNEFRGALALFLFAALILGLCSLMTIVLKKNEFAQYYLKKLEKKSPSVNSTDPRYEQVLNNTQSTLSPGASHQTHPESVLSKDPAPEKGSLALYLTQAKINLKRTDGLLYSLIYVFVLTFICYPGLASDSTIRFLEKTKEYDSWHILFVQACFNSMDAVGRYMGGLACLTLSNPMIKIQSLLRTVYLGIFLLISFDVSPDWLFQTDWFIMLNLILFSITNGYVSTLCAVKAP